MHSPHASPLNTRFSGEMEREPVTQLPILVVNKATLHLNSSSTVPGLVEQCRREPPPTGYFLYRTRKKETPLFYACSVGYYLIEGQDTLHCVFREFKQ